MRVRSVGRQIPGVHVDRPRHRGQSWQVRLHCRDEKSQKSEGDPTVGRASDIACALPAQADRENQADPEDHEEADRI